MTLHTKHMGFVLLISNQTSADLACRRGKLVEKFYPFKKESIELLCACTSLAAPGNGVQLRQGAFDNGICGFDFGQFDLSLLYIVGESSAGGSSAESTKEENEKKHEEFRQLGSEVADEIDMMFVLRPVKFAFMIRFITKIFLEEGNKSSSLGPGCAWKKSENLVTITLDIPIRFIHPLNVFEDNFHIE